MAMPTIFKQRRCFPQVSDSSGKTLCVAIGSGLLKLAGKRQKQ